MSEQHKALVNEIISIPDDEGRVEALLNVEDDERRAVLLTALEGKLPDVVAEVRRIEECAKVEVQIPIPSAVPLKDAWGPGFRVAGRYEIRSFTDDGETEEVCRKGGMGNVYRAYDLRMKRDVALKVIQEDHARNPEWVARFRRETQFLACLEHPNIAVAYDIVEGEWGPFLVMEFVQGRSLADRLKAGRLSPDEALGLCLQVAEALEHAHQKEVIHRDLKPGNVMITPEDKVKVLDFGLAKSVRAGPAAPGAPTDEYLPPTDPGAIIGTAAYMSPEQASGKPVDKRTDVWAFGCVLYECLAGKPAFTGDTTPKVLAAVQRDDPHWDELPAEVPPRVVELVRDCLVKDPNRRRRDIRDVRLEIDKGLEELVNPPPPPPSPSRVAGWSGEFLLGGTTCALFPRVSPDAQWLAFAVMHEGASEVGVMELNSGDWWVLTRNRSRGWVQSVCWSADSTHIYFDAFIDVPVGVSSV